MRQFSESDHCPTPSKPDLLARAAYIAVLAHISNTPPDEVLRKRFPSDRDTAAILTRAAVTPATTTGAGWADTLIQTAVRIFLAHTAPLSAAATLIGLGIQAALEGISTAKHPVRVGNPTAIPWTSESGAIPVAARQMGMVSIVPAKKVALLCALTEEMAKRADGESVVAQLLREDAAWTLDASYFATTAGSSATHQGLLNDVTALTASTAGGAAAMTQDLAALAAAVSRNGSGQVVFIMATERAAVLPILAPNMKVTVLPSPALPANRVIAVDPLALLHATDTSPDISVGRDATLHMSDSPTQISAAGSPNAVAAPVVSMYQTASIALRVILSMAWAKRRADAVAYVDDVDWASVPAAE